MLGALESRGVHADAAHLLELMHVEKELSGALSIVRRAIDAIVTATLPPGGF